MRPIFLVAVLAAAIFAAAPCQLGAASAPPGNIRIAEPRAKTVISPKELIALLNERGYAVDVVTRDAEGNLLFRVGRPDGSGQFLLLVNGRDGTILPDRKPRGHSYRFMGGTAPVS